MGYFKVIVACGSLGPLSALVLVVTALVTHYQWVGVLIAALLLCGLYGCFGSLLALIRVAWFRRDLCRRRHAGGEAARSQTSAEPASVEVVHDPT